MLSSGLSLFSFMVVLSLDLSVLHTWNQTEVTYWETWDLKLATLDVVTLRICYRLKSALPGATKKKKKRKKERYTEGLTFDT